MEIEKLTFMGSKHLGLEVLKLVHELFPSKLHSVITLDDRADTRTEHAHFVKFCGEREIPVHIAADRKHSEKLIHELKPDVVLVVGWFWLISPECLKAVPSGFVGIHNSLLPTYRGSAPIIWAMLNGEKEVGFSYFTFTEGMDDGPVWGKGSVPVGESDYIADVLEKLEAEVLRSVPRVVGGILNGGIVPEAQNHSLATYCAQRVPSDGIIDWSKPASYVHAFIRSQSHPYPGAFTYLNDEKLTIWRAALDPRQYFGTPGQVAEYSGESVAVICGDNKAVLLQTVEGSGGQVPARQVVSSFKIRFPSVHPPATKR